MGKFDRFKVKPEDLPMSEFSEEAAGRGWAKHPMTIS